MPRCWKRIKRWYEGEYVPYKNDPRSSLGFVGGGAYEKHWTAQLARGFVTFYLKHWKWLWTPVIAVVLAKVLL